MASAGTRARVLLVDDHPQFRGGLAAVLGRESELDICEANNANEAIALARDTLFDLAIVDVLMPGSSGITLTSALYDLQPSCRVLGLSVDDEPRLIADMLRARACGYALKTQPVPEIIGAIYQVLGGLRYLPPDISVDQIEAELAGISSPQLSTREQEVHELLMQGHSIDEIAGRLVIARGTVETHRLRLMNKLAALELQRLAARRRRKK